MTAHLVSWPVSKVLTDETDETTSNQWRSERIKPEVHALTNLENFLKPMSHDGLGFRVSVI